ncbi:MAG TPA: hypothetical protein VHJ17_17125 [Thermomonospora sp.]|nr:hypothetical protein [Thermomonospora sp.]
MVLTNQQVAEHAFLSGMYRDGDFPDHLVAKAEAILRSPPGTGDHPNRDTPSARHRPPAAA